MKLIHFSKEPFRFDPQRQYLEEGPFQKNTGFGKPRGLWLSDESDFGWKEWCHSADWGLDSLAHSTEFECDISKWCVIRSTKDAFDFTACYGVDPYPGINLKLIDWKRVKEDHGGLLITPYNWDVRLDPYFQWYYGWDCSSACAWDLSSVKLLTP